jgi:hypothetical protein
MERITIHTLIADAVENISDSFDLNPLFIACQTSKEIKKYRKELWSLHHVCRPIINEPIQVDGEIISGSLITFLLATLTVDILDDHRKFKDFPLITFHEKWNHPLDHDVPISRQSQQVIVDALFGLDWFLFCDVYNDDHTSEMIEQARELFKLLKSRICYFIHEYHLPNTVLNMEIYSNVEKKGLYSKPDTAQFDYDSDDEVFNKRSRIIKATDDLTDKDVEFSFVNTSFVYDMEVYISYFHEQFMLYDTTKINELNGTQPKLSTFRGKLFELVSSVNDKFLIQERTRWQQELEIHSGHIQVYKHHNGLTLKPKPRQIIVTKNDILVTNSMLKSFADITTRDTTFVKQKIRLSTDSMFWVWSLQNDKVVTHLLNKYIWRDRIRGYWIVKIHNQLFRVDSFTHGFFVLRNSLGENGELKNGVFLNAYDSLL